MNFTKIKSLSILFFCFILLFVACKKHKEDNPAPTTGNNTPATPICQFKVTVDGVVKDFKIVDGTEPFDCGVTQSGDIGTGSSSSKFIFGADMTSYNTNEYFSIRKGTLVLATGGYSTTEEFNSLFTTGVVPFSDDALSGIQILYQDANGTQWSTNGTQTGSNFNFTSIDKQEILGTGEVFFNATFNCKLYDGNSNSKTLTNGFAILAFENW